MPTEYIVNLLPDTKAFGRMHKDIKDTSFMPDLQWLNPDRFAVQKLQKSNIKQHTHS